MTAVAAASSRERATAVAAEAAARDVGAALEGAPADLAFVFLSPHHLADAAAAAAAVRATLNPACLVGCVAGGVIGGRHEFESEPAVAVWAGSLPGAHVVPFHVTAEVDDDGEVLLTGLPELGAPALVTLLADPFALPVGDLLDLLNRELPGVPIVGGIATGAGRPGSQALIIDGEIATAGAVGVAIGGVSVEAVVSQGCAPLGPEAVITRAEGNVIYELAGKPAAERLRDVVAGLSPRDRVLVSRGVLAGIVIEENKPEYERGDFLVRPIIGADEATGALAVSALVRVGQTMRFHARDAGSASDDLEQALRAVVDRPGARPAGALLFSCNGRGSSMFPEADHDSSTVAAALGSSAIAGFFCGGEVGPVGGRSFLHSFTATMAIFLDEDSR